MEKCGNFHPLGTAEGVGVHRTRSRSLSLPLVSHPDVRAIDSARLAAAVPMVLRSKSRRAAGVKLPAASDRRGVQDGGAIPPFLPVRGVRLV